MYVLDIHWYLYITLVTGNLWWIKWWRINGNSLYRMELEDLGISGEIVYSGRFTD